MCSWRFAWPTELRMWRSLLKFLVCGKISLIPSEYQEGCFSAEKRVNDTPLVGLDRFHSIHPGSIPLRCILDWMLDWRFARPTKLKMWQNLLRFPLCDKISLIPLEYQEGGSFCCKKNMITYNTRKILFNRKVAKVYIEKFA